jgi:hypothetical protein
MGVPYNVALVLVGTALVFMHALLRRPRLARALNCA